MAGQGCERHKSSIQFTGGSQALPDPWVIKYLFHERIKLESSREDKQRGIREDPRFLALASYPGVSGGAGIGTSVCLTASSFCALPRWLILTLGKETMTTC